MILITFKKTKGMQKALIILSKLLPVAWVLLGVFVLFGNSGFDERLGYFFIIFGIVYAFYKYKK